MENTQTTDQEFACEDCGFTSPLTNDVCPNCSGRMVALDGPVRAKGEDSEGGDDSDFSDAEGGALSLESLQEQESRDEYEPDDYGDDD